MRTDGFAVGRAAGRRDHRALSRLTKSRCAGRAALDDEPTGRVIERASKASCATGRAGKRRSAHAGPGVGR